MREYFTLPVFHAIRGRSVIVHGLKRSGNHAVIHWLRSSAKLDFVNNLLPFDALHARGQLDAHTHQLRHPALGYLTCYTWPWKRRRMVSLEDMPIDRWLFDETKPANVHNLLVVRCPINLFASRIKKGFSMEHPAFPRSMNDIMLRARRLWIAHAREALGETAFLEHKTPVVFDRFIVDSKYRRDIAAALRLQPDDASLSQQAPEGRGSSFRIGDTPTTAASPEALRNRAALLDAQESALLDEVLREPELHRLRAKMLDF
jgi:hypothetical protein